jgi:protein-S-isoprenylcysteine O-methyltransferase Ste14
MFAFMALMPVLARVWPVVSFPSPALIVAGWLLMLASLGVVLFCMRQFRATGTTIRPLANSKKLVTHGLYRYSRNPMYLAMALALAGCAMVSGALSPFFLIVPFVWITQKVFIEGEEAVLRRNFGKDFDVYCKRVRRWI